MGTLKGEPHVREALAAGLSYEEAAKAGGVSRRQVCRRMQDAEYVLSVRQLRGDLLGRAAGRLADLAPKAADALGDLLSGDNATLRRAAAVSILDLAGKLASLADVEARLAALEALLTEHGRQP